MPKERGDLLSSGVRRAIVDLITARPGECTALQLSEELRLHVTTVRFHLDQLEQAGVISSEPERRDRPGRPRKVYSRQLDQTPVNTAAYVILADVLAATLGSGPVLPAAGLGEGPLDDVDVRAHAADRAGAAWVETHLGPSDPGMATPAASVGGEIPVRPLLDTLARWGYPRETVTVEGDPATRCEATLTFCPMLDAARRHPEVVCGIHLGLVRGALEQLDVDDPAVRVTPMVSPGVCTVAMSTRNADGDQRVDDGLDLSHVR